MATQGPFTWFNRGKLKYANGVINLESHTLKAALLSEVQAMSAGFVGASGDCRYSDLTNQIANGNGYTTGGVALTNVAISLSGSNAKFTADPIQWTFTVAKQTKWVAIYSDTAANKDLLCFADFDTDGASNFIGPNGIFIITPAAGGILGW